MTSAFFTPAIDWITLATYDFASYTKLAAEVRRFFGKGWRPGRWLQYDGYKHNDGCFYGHAMQSNDKEHYVMRASGAMAHELFFHLRNNWSDGQDVLGHCYATRLDIQVTSDPPPWWQVRHLHDFYKQRMRKVSMIQSETGSTLYMGSRTSGRFVRFYEKHLDRPYLRLEFELKGDHARFAFASLMGPTITIADVWYAHLDKLNLQPEHRDYYQHHETGLDFPKFMREIESDGQLKWLLSLLPKFQKMANDHHIGVQVRSIFESLAVDTYLDKE